MRLKLFGLPALALAALTVPALSQEPPFAEVATVIGGIADGATVTMGPFAEQPVHMTEPGVFVIGPEEAPAAMLTVTQSATCVFDVLVLVNGDPVGGARFDFNKVFEIDLTQNEDAGTLNTYGIVLQGDAPVSTLAADGTAAPGANTSSMATSLELADIQAAADRLHGELCPGPTN